MPRRPKQPCPEPLCPELTDGGRCPEHRRIREKARGTRQERGYGRRHERWRERVLRRDPVCVRCMENGRTTVATVADHIVPWQQGGAKYDVENGRGLCAACHNQVRPEQGIG